MIDKDTGEVFRIDQMEQAFDTFASLRAAEPPEEVDQKEILAKKMNTGFFAKVFHRGAISENPETNQVKVKVHKKVEQVLCVVLLKPIDFPLPSILLSNTTIRIISIIR